MNTVNFNDFCKSIGCEHYIEWNCGYGDCVSCRLQGESYNIEKLADNCPHLTKGQESQKMWVARNYVGELYLYIASKPIKGEVIWFNHGGATVYIDKNLFPEVKWSDAEPTEVKLVMNKR